MLSNLWSDLRYAAHSLSRSPGFAAAAILTIAIGVGINAGIFSVLNGVLFRALPVPDSQEIVGIAQTIEGIERHWYGTPIMFSTAEYRTYRDSSQTLSGLIGYSTANRVTLGGESPQQIGGTLVTCNYFEVSQRPLALGPGFGANDCEPNAAVPTVVVGHDLWTTAFNADPNIVGREVVLNRQSFRVVGVAAEDMRGFDLTAASYFAPIAAQPLLTGGDPFRDEQASWLTLLGRRAPGATLDQVQAELRVIAARIDQELPPRQTEIFVEAGRPVMRPGARPLVLAASSVVMAAFGLVLLIACANVANLLLARGTGRSGEIAMRLSLGASRGRIVQQLLAESVLIAVLGGALGSMLALWSFQGVIAFALTALPPGSPELNALDTAPDARVFGYALGLTLAAAALFGLLPALRSSKLDLHTAMKGASAAGQLSGSRLQGALVGVQIAVCFVLMIAASLLLRGLYATQTAEPGFRYENVAVASINFGGYDPERALVLQGELIERLRALPDVEAAAHVLLPPLSEGNVYGLAGLPGQKQLLPIDRNNVSADYFSVVEIPLLRGRVFTTADESGTSTEAIVTDATARRLWPERDPIGQTLVVETRPNARRDVQIVGVVGDAQVSTIGEIPSSYVYLPVARTQLGWQLIAKSRGDYAAVATAIRAEVAALDPQLVVQVAPLEANLDMWRNLARVVSTLAASLGAVALVLAVVGVYGVVAYTVGRRVREIGIRVALGARPGDIVALVLKKTMRPVVVGAAIGLLAGLGISHVLSGVLFGVNPTDPAALGVSLLVVVGSAVAASVVPARRGSRVDTNTVLHYE